MASLLLFGLAGGLSGGDLLWDFRAAAGQQQVCIFFRKTGGPT